MEKIGRIIIPVDLTDCSHIATDQGAFFAKLLGVDVSLITIDDTKQFMVSALLEERSRQEKQTKLDEIKKIAESHGVRVSTEILSGAPCEEIIRHASEEDLIVMATKGRKGLNRLVLGSVSEEVLRTAPCSVMVIKPRAENLTESILEAASQQNTVEHE